MQSCGATFLDCTKNIVDYPLRPAVVARAQSSSESPVLCHLFAAAWNASILFIVGSTTRIAVGSACVANLRIIRLAQNP